MQDPPSGQNSSESADPPKSTTNLLDKLDPRARHQLLNEFHGFRTGLYLLDAAFHARDDEIFNRTIRQLNEAIDRMTPGEPTQDASTPKAKRD